MRRNHEKRHFVPRVEQLESRILLHAGVLPSADSASMAQADSHRAPDFALIDVNPASATHNRAVSPSDYANQVSVWMFGYST